MIPPMQHTINRVKATNHRWYFLSSKTFTSTGAGSSLIVAFFWLHITRHLKLGNSCRLNRSGICCRNCKYCLVSICTSSSMVTRMTLLFIILGFPNAPAGLATLMGRMSDAPLSMLMTSSTPVFPKEGESVGWVPKDEELSAPSYSAIRSDSSRTSVTVTFFASALAKVSTLVLTISVRKAFILFSLFLWIR
ncbi:hypothetical protein M095_4720 [Parabacteroides distasonis str. 3999B T(B) 4]|nr:hypothetical protein M095_4720 [Parabacteroides distasonis str. 3999B T(B) 4]